jgi:hypothetical protein
VDRSESLVGNDDPRSTFALRIGTPAHNLVLIAIASQEKWVVAPSGCAPGEPSDSPILRRDTFNPTNVVYLAAS